MNRATNRKIQKNTYLLEIILVSRYLTAEIPIMIKQKPIHTGNKGLCLIRGSRHHFMVEKG